MSAGSNTYRSREKVAAVVVTGEISDVYIVISRAGQMEYSPGPPGAGARSLFRRCPEKGKDWPQLQAPERRFRTRRGLPRSGQARSQCSAPVLKVRGGRGSGPLRSTS